MSITVECNGQLLTGWLNASVRRSLESINATFTAQVDWRAETPKPVKRQDVITVSIANTQMLKAIVTKADAGYSRDEGVMLYVEARALSGDLIIASATHAGGQWKDVNVGNIVADLCKPLNIPVVANTDLGKPLKSFELNQGETILQAISRAAAYRGLLVTADTRGGLLITRAGDTKSEASIRLGKDGNVIRMQPEGSDANRCSEYIVKGQGAANVWGDVAAAADIEARAKDPYLKRYLPLIVNAETALGSQGDAQSLADHAARLRMGRANGYRYTVEGWEVNGEAWLENTLVPIYDPLINSNGDRWLIVDVNAKVDRKEGDVTEILVRPAAAYEQRPIPEPAAAGGIWQ